MGGGSGIDCVMFTFASVPGALSTTCTAAALNAVSEKILLESLLCCTSVLFGHSLS